MKNFFCVWWKQILEGSIYFLTAYLTTMVSELSVFYDSKDWSGFGWKEFLYINGVALVPGLTALKGFLSTSISQQKVVNAEKTSETK